MAGQVIALRTRSRFKQRTASEEERMTRRASILIAVVCLMAATASAQDVRSVLQASAKAMGLTNLKTIQYSGRGWFSLIGQTYGLNEDWTHYEATAAMRPIDSGAQSSRQHDPRIPGKYPTRAPVPQVGLHTRPCLQ